MRSSPERVHVFDMENHEGTPVYVHAELAVVDDVWACVGSANLNRRSWTHDSELSCAVMDETKDHREPRDPAGQGDGARVYARDLRLRLMREHLHRAADGGDDDGLVDRSPRSTRSTHRRRSWRAGTPPAATALDLRDGCGRTNQNGSGC
ncbi:MAG: phospholipase [Mycobacterium sp.]|nr:phospholipase [Mycobacterium sp.]